MDVCMLFLKPGLELSFWCPEGRSSMQFTFLFTSSCSFFPPFSWRIWVPDTSCPQENVVRIMCIFRRMMPSQHSHCTGFKKWGSSPGVTDGSGAQQISLLTPSLEPFLPPETCACATSRRRALRVPLSPGLLWPWPSFTLNTDAF